MSKLNTPSTADQTAKSADHHESLPSEKLPNDENILRFEKFAARGNSAMDYEKVSAWAEFFAKTEANTTSQGYYVVCQTLIHCAFKYKSLTKAATLWLSLLPLNNELAINKFYLVALSLPINQKTVEFYLGELSKENKGDYLEKKRDYLEELLKVRELFLKSLPNPFTKSDKKVSAIALNIAYLDDSLELLTAKSKKKDKLPELKLDKELEPIWQKVKKLSAYKNHTTLKELFRLPPYKL